MKPLTETGFMEIAGSGWLKPVGPSLKMVVAVTKEEHDAIRPRRSADRSTRSSAGLASAAAATAALLVVLPTSSSARPGDQVALGLWPAGRGTVEAALENGAVLGTCAWNARRVHPLPGGARRLPGQDRPAAARARRRADRRRDRAAPRRHDHAARRPVSSPWHDWVPLRPGRGSYVLVVKLLDERRVRALDCVQSPPFGGLSGLVRGKRLGLCAAAD